MKTIYFKTIGAIFCVFALLAWIASLSYRSFERYMNESQKMVEIQKIASATDAVTQNMYQVELEQHYFLVTGKQKYMLRFTEAKNRLQQSLQHLQTLPYPPSFAVKVKEIERLILERIAAEDQLVQTREETDYMTAFQIFLQESSRQQIAELDEKLKTISIDTKNSLLRLSETAKESRDQAAQNLFSAAWMAFFVFLISSLLIIRDLRYREKKEKELMEARAHAVKVSEFKSRFLANMSHEIRTPLNSIIGLGDVLLETELTPQQRHHVQTYQKAGESLLVIINDILDLTKVESGELQLENIDFQLPDLCQDVIEVMLFRARTKNINLELNCDPQVSKFVRGDPTRLKQILMNLVVNSIKFTEIGYVRLTVKPDGERTLFEIKDTGKGIAKNKIDDIFRPFAQEETSTTRRYGGTGLGLSITKKLVELMGGEIHLESELGVGSTFTVRLPLKEANGSVERVIEKPKASGEQTHTEIKNRPTKSILVVDDTEENRDLIQVFLSEYPIQLDYAVNGEEAIEQCRKKQYDLILMDMQMPVLDGYEATRKVRELEKYLHRSPTKIVALSACAFQNEREQSLQAGCDHYLVKPIRKRDLVSTVYQTLGEKNQIAA
jgi:signal transduction histidine kinase/ActR/RegA family two-component response regulator